MELEIREYSNADFYLERYPHCHLSDISRNSYTIRMVQDLGHPHLCRRIRYERVYFKCKKCEKVFTIEHPFIIVNSNYMHGMIDYAISRVLDRSDSIRRVHQVLNELYHVEISVGTVENWVNKYGEKKNFPQISQKMTLPMTSLDLCRWMELLNR
ncbi:MAG: hypothetical protein ACOC1X_04275 [Promethearchaeota archaeon]